MTPATRCATKSETRRRTAALTCAAKLDQAANALHAFLRACAACGDDSESLSSQGKGVDSRETLIRDLAEYSGYLQDVYGRRE